VRLLVWFTVPVPPSSKNAQRIAIGKDGTPRRYRPKKVVDAANGIRAAALVALARIHRTVPEPEPDADLRVECVHEVATDRLHVTVHVLGPKPKGKTGRRRDVVNLPELVCDALQGVAYRNDSQVSELRVVRVAPGKETW